MKIFLTELTVLVVAGIMGLLTGSIFSYLWDWLVPTIFPGPVESGAILPTLRWYQGWGIMFICSMVFNRVQTGET